MESNFSSKFLLSPLKETNSSNFSQIQLLVGAKTSIFWENIHLKFTCFVLPAVILASFLENLFSLIILLNVKSGIGRTTKFLFIQLTLADIANLTCFYGLNYLAIDSLKIITDGRFYLKLVLENNIACKLARGMSFFTMHTLNWLYVLINVERFFAVCFPHGARHLFNKQKSAAYVLFIVTIGALFSFYFGFHYTVQTNKAAICVTNILNHNHWLVSRLLYVGDALLGPNLIALALALINLVLIRKQLIGTQLKNKAVRKHNFSKCN